MSGAIEGCATRGASTYCAKMNGNRVAGGFTSMPRAARMLSMQWDGNLAMVAEAAVRLCRLEKLYCATVPHNLWTGQNEAMESSDCLQPTEIVLRKQLAGWIRQGDYASPHQLQNPLSWVEAAYYLQMVRDRCDRFGCAISRFTIGAITHQLLKCIYSCTVALSSRLNPVYEVSKEYAGEKCQSGRSTAYPHLCNTVESAKICYATESVQQPHPTTWNLPQLRPGTGYPNPSNPLYPAGIASPGYPGNPGYLPPFPQYPPTDIYVPRPIPPNPSVAPPGPAFAYPSPPPHWTHPPPFITIFGINILRTAAAPRRARPRPRINGKDLGRMEYDFSDYVQDVDPCDSCTTTPCNLKYHCL
ncbi:uncharacterized protein LOC111071752 isoform X2 [Drosophila obscura]|uniref:uncharacterized protein LOC111071752 isoform X2 n=1 Tax=Drosophila obscura TaxID=7282 RepID=UPI001BB1728E|nr:uncharacterized protein LOC111071752 isoform X2 [Drosophila obscura]